MRKTISTHYRGNETGVHALATYGRLGGTSWSSGDEAEKFHCDTATPAR